jgi:hypothetical protein
MGFWNQSGAGPGEYQARKKSKVLGVVILSSPMARTLTIPYGMGRPRADRDAAQDLARELADLAAQLASLKGEANTWLSDESYGALRHRLEDAHAAVEAAAVEAKRRVRVNEGRGR